MYVHLINIFIIVAGHEHPQVDGVVILRVPKLNSCVKQALKSYIAEQHINNTNSNEQAIYVGLTEITERFFGNHFLPNTKY